MPLHDASPGRSPSRPLPRGRPGRAGRRPATGIALRGLLLAALAAAPCATPARALPPGFSETTVFSGLVQPVAVKFSIDGRVFVAEKSGLVKVFDGLADATPTTVADLRPNVHNFWDRGLLGLAIDPAFPAEPYIYVLYTYDFDPLEPSVPAPRWGDTCPDRDAQDQIVGPGATVDGCVVNGRLSRLRVNPDNSLDGGEQVLLENRWCQQFPSHTVGSLVFGPEGALYVSAGDGGSFNSEDWGQFGGTRGPAPQAWPFTPANPCADPNGSRGVAATKPSAEGGALRAQDLRTPGDPAALNGAVLRLDPATGEAWPDNPLVGGASADDDRIIAHGLRNPFRMTGRPGTGEIWVGDVGWKLWEEINRIVDPADAVVENFGWPCVEGPGRPIGYNNNLDLCAGLPTGETTAPFFNFRHGLRLHIGDPCSSTSGSSISGLAFYSGGAYPASYAGALFFADYSRNCVYMMGADAQGMPNPFDRSAFVSAVADAQQVGDPLPVNLEIGPGGDLFIVDFDGGRIRRVEYNVGNSPPTARIAADPANGLVPLEVAFDGASSSDPDPGATLFYAWDLDGDGEFDDAMLPQASWTYTEIGDVVVRLRVTDDDGASATAQVTITAGNSPPLATIATPAPDLTWHVGEVIPFSGAGDDPTDGPLPPAALRWAVVLRHCVAGPGTCHDHSIETFEGVATGSFTAPDHEYYSEIEFRLTVTDSGGLAGTASVVLAPEVVVNDFATTPPGLTLAVAGEDGAAPFSRPAIVGSRVSLVAPAPQGPTGPEHYFVSWDDGGDAGRSFTATAAPQAFHATFAACVADETDCDGLDNDCDGVVDDVAVPSGSFTLTVDHAGLAWTAAPGALEYDIVRGRLTAAGVTPFSAESTDGCVAAAVAGDSVPFALDPPEGEAWWLVARGRNCGGAGSFDCGGPAQSGSRDPGVAAAPSACP